jgi:hypothetical protein
VVTGLDRFAEHFAGYGDRYVLIGGAATFVAMDAAGIDFRVTKDLDIVLCLEALDIEFARVFWDFIHAAGYEVAERSSGTPILYRFKNPRDNTYPQMIELLSRAPDLIGFPADAHLAPIPISDQVASLSAILIDDDYYRLVMDGRRSDSGVTVLAPTHLIPLKAKAWLDLTERRASGQTIQSGDIKKHRNDVLRLSQLIPPAEAVAVPERIKADMASFIAQALSGAPGPNVVGVTGITLADVKELLVGVYGLESLA